MSASPSFVHCHPDVNTMRVGRQPWAQCYCAIAVAVARDVSDRRWDDGLVGLELLNTGRSALAFQSQGFTGRRIEVGLRRVEMWVGDLSI